LVGDGVVISPAIPPAAAATAGLSRSCRHQGAQFIEVQGSLGMQVRKPVQDFFDLDLVIRLRHWASPFRRLAQWSALPLHLR
jgi:hypothetical protein